MHNTQKLYVKQTSPVQLALHIPTPNPNPYKLTPVSATAPRHRCSLALNKDLRQIPTRRRQESTSSSNSSSSSQARQNNMRERGLEPLRAKGFVRGYWVRWRAVVVWIFVALVARSSAFECGGDTSTSDREVCMSVQTDNTIMDSNVLKTSCTKDLVFVTRIFLFVKKELSSVYYLMYLSSY